MSRYSFSLLIAMALCTDLVAQDVVVIDSTKNKFLPTGIRIGTDLLAIGKSNYVDYWKGWEINVDADFNRRYYFAVDYGRWASTYVLPNGMYNNEGNYSRVGIDVNFLQKDPDRNMFFVGFRHGWTKYADHAEYTYNDVNFGEIYVNATNPEARAHWEELTLGLRVKLWKFIWMGATSRLKFRMVGKDQWELLSYDVPGYGKTFKNNWWGINYQIFIRIPVRPDK